MYNNKLAVNGISDYTEGSDVHALYLTSKLSYTIDIINVIEGLEKKLRKSQNYNKSVVKTNAEHFVKM